MTSTRTRTPAIERFVRFVVPDGDCLRWIGGSDRKGYGRFRDENSRLVASHRWAYEQRHGPIPRDREIDHVCRHPWCVNVDHLEVVTFLEQQRRKAAAKVTCTRGHPWVPENMRYRRHRDGSSYRCCRVCHREDERERRERNRVNQ